MDEVCYYLPLNLLRTTLFSDFLVTFQVSMAEVSHGDLVEHIIERLDVKDLLRFKSVCKSWHSLITSPRFVSHHLNHSYNKDRHDNEIGSRRIVLEDEFPSYGFDKYHLVGSSNGLVCIICVYSGKLLVGNPMTREERQLRSLPALIGSPLFWGFGYDSSRDDYTVIVGTQKDKNQTRVQVLSLKSNVWRVVGEVGYTHISKDIGILCNGALHWIVRDGNGKKLVISYDLSTEEFKEIPLPGGSRHEGSNLGIFEECLCIFQQSDYCFYVDVWLMKGYNVKESWELLPGHVKKYDIVLFLSSPKDDDASWFTSTLEHQGLQWGCAWGWNHTDAPIFLRSLVSPHVNNKRSAKKSIKGSPFAPGSNTLV